MTEHVPVTLKQLQFFNIFVHRVYIEKVTEIFPGITEFRCGIETPDFSPLRSSGYIWLDEDGNMVANIVTEKRSRPYPRDVNDREHYRNHDFPVKVRLFPHWRERWMRDDHIVKEYPEGHMTSLPGCDSALKYARDWIKEAVESEVSA